MNTCEENLREELYELESKLKRNTDLEKKLKEIEKRRLSIVFHGPNKWVIEDKIGELSYGSNIIDAIYKI